MANSESSSGIGAIAAGFILGAAVGVAIGMLYAPRAGVDTRAMIAEKAEEAKEKAGEAVETVKEKAAKLRNRPEEA
jgi:gas vesicle protein